MTIVDRAEAHRRVDSYYDALDALQGVNDPAQDPAARNAAYNDYVRVREIGAPLVAERLAAARLDRHWLHPGVSWGPVAREYATAPVAPAAKDMDPEEAAHQRYAAARYLMDHESELPANLARNIAGGLLLLNLGSDAPIFRRYRVKGLISTSGVDNVRNFFVAILVYYLAGHRNKSLDEVMRKEAHIVGSLNVNTLNKLVRKLNIRAFVETVRDQGRADGLAGKPEAPPYVGVRDLVALARINNRTA
jgi:hypothetical protein